MIEFPGGGDARPITLLLNDIPFEAALRNIAEFGGYEVRLDSHAIVFAPIGAETISVVLEAEAP